MGAIKQTHQLTTMSAMISKDILAINTLFDNYQNLLTLQGSACVLANCLRNTNHEYSNSLLKHSLQIQQETALQQTVIICIKVLIKKTERNILTEKNKNTPLNQESESLEKLKKRLEGL